MSTIEVFFPDVDEAVSEVLIAELSMLGYDPFWQDDDGLRAYVDAGKLDKSALVHVVEKYRFNVPVRWMIQETVPDQWDRVQEPIAEAQVIANQVTLLHPDSTKLVETPYSVLLDARMAFGDGSHPSTALCIEIMTGMDFKDKRVVDVGTGSGILAILANKMGAASVLAFDNNPWSIEVSGEMVPLNKCNNVQLKQAEIETIASEKMTYDVVLANLNFMVFKDEFKNVVALTAQNGLLLLSGFMESDADAIAAMALKHKLNLIQTLNKNQWSARLFLRNRSY